MERERLEKIEQLRLDEIEKKRLEKEKIQQSVVDNIRLEKKRLEDKSLLETLTKANFQRLKDQNTKKSEKIQNKLAQLEK